MGFLEDMAKNAALWSAVQASKDASGKPDPYKAAGMAAGMGRFSMSDRARLGAMLGSEGAFDDNTGIDFGGGSNADFDEYSWRDECEEGIEYGVDPEDYEDEDEYEEALNEVKYGWRDECEEGIEYGVDPEDYETEEEYEEALLEVKELYEEDNREKKFALGSGTDKEIIALANCMVEAGENVNIPITLKVSTGARRERNPEAIPIPQTHRVVRPQVTEEALNDKTIYLYCGVVFENSSYPYHYRTEDASLKIGDKVIVPVGPENEEVSAEIVSVEQHRRISVPYPLEKVKWIIGKVE